MKFVFFALGTVLVGIGLGCGSAYSTPENSDGTTVALEHAERPSDSITIAPSDSQSRSAAEFTEPKQPIIDEPVASYLEETVEPCVQMLSPEVDPCERRRWTLISIENDYKHPDQKEVLIIERASSLTYPPLTTRESIRHAFESEFGRTNPSHRRAPHVVVRGVYIPSTTRCEFHERQVVLTSSSDIKLTDPEKSPGYAQEIACYLDFQVSEYLVGRGPARLTIRPWYWVPIAGNEDNELFRSDEYQKHLASHVSPRWEGREFVLWLGINQNLAAEVWRVTGLMDVQRREGGEIVAVSPALSNFSPERSDIAPYLDRLEPTLEEYTQDVVSEHAAVSSELGFTIVEDANIEYLREHLSKVGIYDQDEIEISLPPPISE